MKRFAFIPIASLLLAGLVAGCKKDKPTKTDEFEAGTFAENLPDLPFDKKVKTDLVKGEQAFGLDLYGKLRKTPGNLFFSPYSISSALAMAFAGAEKQTAEQMAKTLHFPNDQKALHPAYTALIKEIHKAKKPRRYQLSIANSLWGQQDCVFKEDFLSTLKTHYGAGLKKVDFKGSTEEARKTINNWVEKQTQDKIQELLVKGILKPVTRLVITNAIYFKGDWASQFKKKETENDSFWLASREKVTAPLMHQLGTFPYLAEENFQALELPYVGDKLSMVVFLPRSKDGLTEFERSLTSANLTKWLSHLGSSKVKVSLPRFKMTGAFSLKDQLQELGMVQAFEDDADFSKISRDEDLKIGAIIHKAFVEVNEEGTEAAAATAVVFDAKKSDDHHKEVIPVFRADHPFFFVIRDRESGMILFMGRLANPKA
jgi:serpin B